MAQAQHASNPNDSKRLNALEWRCIGPPRGGRVVAVAGDPVNPAVFYFGACAGGVWKTDDGGTYWHNISDGYVQTASVGALAVAEADPNVIYAGMGESCIRLDVSYGDGVYKSTDGGKTWTHLGLADTRHIARIRIHPHDPDIVYVAGLGHAFGTNRQRGVFRSTNGGQTWEHVLFKSDTAGAADLSLDPNNPRILYAAIWQVQRNFWSLTSGGPDSGLYQSTDGGDTWTEITNNPGLPGGLKGRMGVAVSPAKPDRVWATIEAEDCGLFRSDDGGATWETVSDDRDLQGRPWYYQHVFADPQDPDTVWILNYQAWKSIDGGKNFSQVTTPHGDNHDLWIDPRQPQRMIEGNDGGACVSFNGGASWSTIYNQLTAQFYHVTTDSQFPYRVYGTQQDNSAISVPSRTHKGVIPWGDCYTVGTSESGYIAVHPEAPNIVISGAIGSSPGGGGNLLRYDHNTGQIRIITVWPEINTGYGAKDMKYRFQWTYPIFFSPHDANELYVAGNVVFRSTDQGSSWQPISPDLTRNDVSKLGPSGGPITKDTSGAETYATIFALVESPHEKGVFWTGSDDGLVHISRDAGATWDNITPPGLPEWTLISMIEASPHDAASAYMAATRYKLDDNRPMLYKTNDYGKTWLDISPGIPVDDYTRVIREDPMRRGLLYVGTETGVYVSVDDGASWQSMQANLPIVPVYDLMVKDDDIIAATHGRSFWILDDLTQLRQVADGLPEQPFHLLQPRHTYRPATPFRVQKLTPGKNYQRGVGGYAAYTETKKPDGDTALQVLDGGTNPPDGVIVTYYLQDTPPDDITLSFLDANGDLIQAFSSRAADHGVSDQAEEQRVPVQAGMNRFIWHMRYPEAHKIPNDKLMEDRGVGPLAPPGTYQVRLEVAGASQTQTFDLLKDPRVAASQADFDAQFALLMQIRDKLSETHDAVNQLRSIRQQVDEWVHRAAGHVSAAAVSQAADAWQEKLTAIEHTLTQVDYKGARDRLNLPAKLNAKLAELTSVVAAADFAPPQQAYDVFHDLSGRIDAQLRQFDEVMKQDVSAFERLVLDLRIPAIVPRTTP
ncbi:hypothetical protein NKDENANG_02669 [Candidatus Entotheonellaceae bacterium PAL068K]